MYAIKIFNSNCPGCSKFVFKMLDYLVHNGLRFTRTLYVYRFQEIPYEQEFEQLIASKLAAKAALEASKHAILSAELASKTLRQNGFASTPPIFDDVEPDSMTILRKQFMRIIFHDLIE